MPLDMDDDGWHVLPDDWWRISYSSVDWNDKQPRLRLSPLLSLPGLDYSSSGAHNDELNPDLAGVRAVEDVLGLYESLVGFHTEEKLAREPHNFMATDIPHDKLAFHKETWERLMTELMDFDAADWSPKTDSSSNSSYSGLSSSISTLDSLDLARPSTPKPKLSPNMDTSREIRSCSPRHVKSSPTPVLISLPSSSPQPALYPSNFSDFTFPSLTTPPPVPKLKILKDEQGFYSVEEVKPSPRPSATLLPPFLQNATQRRKAPVSKTRSIVDRLRKAEESPVRSVVSQSPSPTPPFSNDRPILHTRLSVSEDGIYSPDEESDGWVGLNTKEEVKARRARDLFRALRRHRSDSTSLSDSGKESSQQDPDDSQDSQSSLPPLSSSSTSPSPSSSAQSSNDGWIEGVVTPPPKVMPRKRTQSKKKNSPSHNSHPSNSSISFPQFHSPALPHFPPLPNTFPPFNAFVHPHHHHPQLPLPQAFPHQPNPTPASNPPYFYVPYPIVPMQSPYVTYPLAYHHPGAHIRQPASSISRPAVR